jgi:hypothetical protein
MNKHRPFGGEVVEVAARAPGRVGERKQVLLEALVAELTGEEQVRPGISEPEVTRLLEGIAIALPETAFRPVMLDVTVSYVADLGLAERALALLGRDQGVLHGFRAVERAVEIERALPVLERPLIASVVRWPRSRRMRGACSGFVIRIMRRFAAFRRRAGSAPSRADPRRSRRPASHRSGLRARRAAPGPGGSALALASRARRSLSGASI